jgi:hypothetical protein
MLDKLSTSVLRTWGISVSELSGTWRSLSLSGPFPFGVPMTLGVSACAIGVAQFLTSTIMGKRVFELLGVEAKRLKVA